MKTLFLASGSKGNCSLIYTDKTLVMIDMGISLKSLKAGLERIGRGIDDIKACFVTHDHSDHICGFKHFPHPNIYSLPGAFEGSKHLEIGVGETIGDLTIIPLKTSHDAYNPCGYIIFDDHSTLAYITDTGKLGKKTLKSIVNCDYYLFESNYDRTMLKESGRPIYLKKRIDGPQGHLSNVQSAEYLSGLLGENTKKVYLAHISQECNTKEKALQTHMETYKEKGMDVSHIEFFALDQFEPMEGCER